MEFEIVKLDINLDGDSGTEIAAIENKQIIGSVMISHKETRSACITQLFVREDKRRQGVGRKLVEECCDISIHKCETIGLLLKKGNKAEGFYCKLGFVFAYQYDNGDSLLIKFLTSLPKANRRA